MTKPRIVTKLPGIKAQKILKKDKKYISPSYTRSYPAVIEQGEGCWVWDVDGNKFLDFNAGIAVCATGHCHPEVVEAIRKQAGKLIHISGTDYYYPQQVELAEKLAEITPGGKNKKVFFCNSGAEAVEGAFKLARFHTKRPYALSFFGSFHGRTMGALSLTGSKVVHKQGFAPLVPGVFHIPYAYCFRCFFRLEYPGCDFYCVKYIEEEVFKKIVPPEEVSALFAEPIQGEGGYIVPPDGYFQKIRELCDRYDILFVVDEVQSGFGRTGRMFAIEHYGVMADIYCLAKGIASGMPIGAFVSRSGIMNWPPGAHASTFGGNPVSCVAALTTIHLLENGLIENAEKVGRYLLKELEVIQSKFEAIGDVRGKGLMIGIELIEDSIAKKPIPERRDAVVYKCFEKGLILQGCGPSTIRFSPPLIVTQEEADVALEIFEEALKEVFKS
jgi:4-aminobutyrate aminotransferase